MISDNPDSAFTSPPHPDHDRQEKARTYTQARRRLRFGEMGLSLSLLLVLVFTGISPRFTSLLDLPVVAEAVVFFLAITISFEALTFPFSYYSGFVLPRRFGISHRKLSGWLADLAKEAILSLGFGAAVVAAVYWLFLAFLGVWWLIAWGLALLVNLVLSIVSPVILVPLFYKVVPLADTDLRSRLEILAQKAGARIRGIFVLDFSTKVTSANAGLMGIGRTRRIVLSDTLLRQYPPPEIEVITAHEIGHHMNRDIYRLFAFQAGVYLVILVILNYAFKAAVASLGYSGIADPAALPLLILISGALGFLASPLVNTFTRYVEKQADIYALRLTNDPQAFVRAMTRLTDQNLSVANPSAWEEVLFYDHPSYHRRVKLAGYFTDRKPRPDRRS